MDGILIIDKESGMTSRDVVNMVGKNYKDIMNLLKMDRVFSVSRIPSTVNQPFTPSF